MKDPSTGVRTNLLRISGAGVVGVFHQLIDKNLVKVLHGYGLYLYIKIMFSCILASNLSKSYMLNQQEK